MSHRQKIWSCIGVLTKLRIAEVGYLSWYLLQSLKIFVFLLSVWKKIRLLLVFMEASNLFLWPVGKIICPIIFHHVPWYMYVMNCDTQWIMKPKRNLPQNKHSTVLHGHAMNCTVKYQVYFIIYFFVYILFPVYFMFWHFLHYLVR